MVEHGHCSLVDPANTYETVLQGLLKIFSQREYGREHHADQIGSLEDFQHHFPIRTYEEYKPLINRVMAGETSLLLNNGRSEICSAPTIQRKRTVCLDFIKGGNSF